MTMFWLCNVSVSCARHAILPAESGTTQGDQTAYLLQHQVFWCFRFEVKHVSGMGGRSPPRGGAAAGAAIQQFLADSEEEATDDRQAGATAEAQAIQTTSKKRKVPFKNNG